VRNLEPAGRGVAEFQKSTPLERFAGAEIWQLKKENAR